GEGGGGGGGGGGAEGGGRSQTRKSPAPVCTTSWLPSGLKADRPIVTRLVSGPSKRATGSHVAVSISCTSDRPRVTASSLPSGLKAAPPTSVLCSRRTSRTRSPETTSHMSNLIEVPVTSQRLSGLKVTLAPRASGIRC